MTKYLFVFFAILVSASVLPANEALSAPVAHTADASLQQELRQKVKRKGKKGYKKPKKKKFLGIFKRKSSCDCPKH